MSNAIVEKYNQKYADLISKRQAEATILRDQEKGKALTEKVTKLMNRERGYKSLSNASRLGKGVVPLDTQEDLDRQVVETIKDKIADDFKAAQPVQPDVLPATLAGMAGGLGIVTASALLRKGYNKHKENKQARQMQLARMYQS